MAQTRVEPLMRVILVAMCLVAIAMMACGPSAMPTESESSTNSEQPEESGPALLLSEESAISILQVYLQDCLHGWDFVYANRVREQMRTPPPALTSFERREALRKGNARRSAELQGTVFPTSTPRPTRTPLPPDLLRLPPSEQQKKSWLMALATGPTGDIVWSAKHHGVSEVPNSYTRAGTAIEAETWVVIGPGLGVAGNNRPLPGRWQVYAGHQRAYYLDAPARLALEEYDSYDSCP